MSSRLIGVLKSSGNHTKKSSGFIGVLVGYLKLSSSPGRLTDKDVGLHVVAVVELD